MRLDSEPGYISPNRLAGSLADTPVQSILEACKASAFTGTLRVRAGGVDGGIELRAGAVQLAALGDERGDHAVACMRALRDGEYRLVQRLPAPGGKLASAACLEGDVNDMSLVELMRHCEDHALSCTVVVISEFDRGEIVYRAGEIVSVSLNGESDEDDVVRMLRFENASFQVTAPPLELGIQGWPIVGREPTAPFRLDSHAPRPRARGTRRPLPGVAEPPTVPRVAKVLPPPPPRSRERAAAAEPPPAPPPAVLQPLTAPDATVRTLPAPETGAAGWVWFAVGAVIAMLALAAAFALASAFLIPK